MSDIINFYNTNSITTYDDAQDFLKKEPYFLDLKYDGNIYRISHIEGKSDRNNKIVKTFSGLILKKDNIGDILYRGQSLSEQIVVENTITNDDIKTVNVNDWEHITVQKLYDGSRIKVFYIDGVGWNISTSRCINACKAFWNSPKSFYQLFMECLGNFNLESLDKNKCYTFIIQHPENRIVIPHSVPSLIHVSTYDKNTNNIVDIDIGLPKAEVCVFESFNQLIENLLSLEHTSPGYMLIDNNHDRVHLICSKYDKIRKLKGNVPLISQRYLQLRKSSTNDISKFLEIFPEYKFICDDVEKHLTYICKTIFHKYQLRRKQHRRVFLTPIEREIQYKVHGLYLGMRIQNNINQTNIVRSIALDDITFLVNGLPVYKILQLLRESNISI